VAVADLPAGSILAPDDLAPVSAPASLVPVGSLVDPGAAAGRTLASPLRAGEVVTDADLSTAGLAEGLDAGTLVAHVPLGNPPLAAAASPGTRVDVVSLLDGSTVAADVLVLAPDGPGGSGLFVAVAAGDAGELARHGSPGALEGGVTVVLHPPRAPALP
jgi:pilus assembly protein CpaB